jgi:hypothetical protein
MDLQNSQKGCDFLLGIFVRWDNGVEDGPIVNIFHTIFLVQREIVTMLGSSVGLRTPKIPGIV